MTDCWCAAQAAMKASANAYRLIPPVGIHERMTGREIRTDTRRSSRFAAAENRAWA